MSIEYFAGREYFAPHTLIHSSGYWFFCGTNDQSEIWNWVP